jgi:mitochondrial FAD-linked sulfhydryl oxidase
MNEAASSSCDTQACSSKDDMMKMMRKVVIDTNAAKNKNKNKNKSSSEEEDNINNINETLKSCPLSREDLGNSTWSVLHSVAANFPDKPSALQKVQARRFFDALADLYPCAVCKEDFKEDVMKNPPDVSSREKLSVWVCQRHNEVNVKLGKPEMDCALKTLDKRWKNGGARCGSTTPSE